jgi:hypothetical protein
LLSKSYTAITGIFWAGVKAFLMFPVVNVAPGDALVKIRIKTCEPVTGGVMFATCVVPVKNVIRVVGAIVAAAAIVGEVGCKLDCTVEICWNSSSFAISISP